MQLIQKRGKILASQRNAGDNHNHSNPEKLPSLRRIKALIKQCPEIVNYQPLEGGKTPLIEAASNNDLSLVEVLLLEKYDINIYLRPYQYSSRDKEWRNWYNIFEVVKDSANNINDKNRKEFKKRLQKRAIQDLVKHDKKKQGLVYKYLLACNTVDENDEPYVPAEKPFFSQAQQELQTDQDLYADFKKVSDEAFNGDHEKFWEVYKDVYAPWYQDQKTIGIGLTIVLLICGCVAFKLRKNKKSRTSSHLARRHTSNKKKSKPNA